MKKAALVLVASIATPICLAGQASDSDPIPLLKKPSYDVAMDLEFELRVPKVLIFRVGSPGNTIDDVMFDLSQSAFPPVADQPYTGPLRLGDSAPIAASNNGTLEVEVKANAGTISISASVSNSMGLSNGNGAFIAFDEISATSDSTGLPTPQLSNSTTAPVIVTANRFSGLVTEQIANWTYSYLNTTKPSAGIYTGTVTYTATAP